MGKIWVERSILGRGRNIFRISEKVPSACKRRLSPSTAKVMLGVKAISLDHVVSAAGTRVNPTKTEVFTNSLEQGPPSEANGCSAS